MRHLVRTLTLRLPLLGNTGATSRTQDVYLAHCEAVADIVSGRATSQHTHRSAGRHGDGLWAPCEPRTAFPSAQTAMRRSPPEVTKLWTQNGPRR